MYFELARDYPESDHGQMAKKRAEQLDPGSSSYHEISRFYTDMQINFRIPDEKKTEQLQRE
jgi:hypothetical protein